MKKVILVMAVAALFAFTGTVMASPPVPPPEEGFKITTDTNIVAVGQVTENESFSWHWNNGNADGIAPNGGGNLAFNESEARIRYTEEFNSNNTLAGAGDFGRDLRAEAEPGETPPTTFDKKFVAESHPTDNPNVTVDKVIGYTSDGAPGSVADFDDKIAIEVVSDGGAQAGAFAGIFVLCPWVGPNVAQLWPVNAGVAMGSSFDIPNLMANGAFGSISANIESDAEVTSQVTLGYDITATGAGRVNAAMLAKLYDGVDPQGQQGGVTPLGSVATYSEFAEANGFFAPFHRKMDFASNFLKPSPTPEIIDQILP